MNDLRSEMDLIEGRSSAGLSDREGSVSRESSDSAAGAAMVNRTRRVVRERAQTMQRRKSRLRSLYIPLAVSAGLLGAVVFAIWSVLLGYDTTNTWLPDSSQQILVLLMWCLPVSAALLGAVWMRRPGTRLDSRTSDGRPQ